MRTTRIMASCALAVLGLGVAAPAQAYWRVGENAAVLKAFPPDVSGPTVSVTYRTLPMPMPRDARV